MEELLVKQYYEEGKAYLKERAEGDIKKNRMGDFTVRLLDKDGKPVTGRTIRFKHKTHDFDFGANFFMYNQYDTPEENLRYEEKWKKLFNTAVVPLYWEGTEPKRGNLRYSADTPNTLYRRPPADAVLDWCVKNGVRPKGHPLFWHEFIPKWLPEKWEELYPLLEKRFQEISERYAGKISVFDCVNEPARVWNVHEEHRNDDWKHVVPPEDYVKSVFDLARKYFPTNELMLNEAVGGSFVEFHGRYSAYYLNIKDLLSRGVTIDRIGLQCHTNEKEKYKPVYDARSFYDVLDTYADFGKPLVLSEVSVLSEYGGVEEQEFQADIANLLYTACFSHKSVNGIFWWNLTDDGILRTKRKASGENLPSAGLIDGNYQEKLAYKEIDRLINHEWRTDVTITTDSDGKVSFCGFNGEYEVLFENDTLSDRNLTVHLSSETGEYEKTIRED